MMLRKKKKHTKYENMTLKWLKDVVKTEKGEKVIKQWSGATDSLEDMIKKFKGLQVAILKDLDDVTDQDRLELSNMLTLTTILSQLEVLIAPTERANVLAAIVAYMESKGVKHIDHIDNRMFS